MCIRDRCDSGDLVGSQEVLHEALAKARGDRDPTVEAEVLAALGWLEQKKCNFGGADLLFTRVLNRAVKVGDVRRAASAALGQAGIAQTTGRFRDAEELYEEATEGFHQGEDPLGVARAQLGLACTRRQQLQLSVAEELFHDVIRASEALGATPLLMEARVGMADLHRARGDFARARQVYQACARWAERQNVFDRAILAHLSLAHIALLEDDLAAMYRHAHHAAEHLERVPGHWLWARYRLVVATLLVLRKDRDEAYRWLWSAAELGIGDTVDQDNAYFLTVLVHVAASMGWPNIVTVAGKLAREQWERLGRLREAARVERAISLQSKAS